MLKRLSAKKTVEYLFYLFIFLLPWQTRWIFRDYQIGGQVFEYGRLSLYGFDIILIVIMAILLYCRMVKGERRETRNQKSEIRQGLIFIFLCFYILLVLIFGAHEKIIGFYWLVRFLLGIGLFWVAQKINFSKIRLAIVVVIAGFIEGFLAVEQFVTQTVVSNKWLGMAGQRAGELGAAVVEAGGQRWLRAYGSLPHPNILGGFLILAFGAVGYLVVRARDKYQKRFVWLSGLAIAAGIFLSFSRAAWLAFLILYVGGWVYAIRNDKEIFFKKVWLGIGALLVIMVLVNAPLVGTRLGRGEHQRLEIKSKIERISGYGQAIKLIERQPFGMGLGNYALAVRDYYKIEDPWEVQPVHNTYLMIGAELGVIGFLLIVLINYYIVKLLLRSQSWWSLGILMTIYGLMLFDHFWWTTASGWYLWWLAMGLGYKERER